MCKLTVKAKQAHYAVHAHTDTHTHTLPLRHVAVLYFVGRISGLVPSVAVLRGRVQQAS